MEKRELAEKIVLALIESGIIQLSEVKSYSPIDRVTLEKVQDRAKRIKAMIDAVEKVL